MKISQTDLMSGHIIDWLELTTPANRRLIVYLLTEDLNIEASRLYMLLLAFGEDPLFPKEEVFKRLRIVLNLK